MIGWINRPRSVVGAVTAAVLVTAGFMGVLVLMWRLIENRWLFKASHLDIWFLGFFGFQALFTAIALIHKAREDNRKAPAPPPAPIRHRLSGPGGA